LTNTVTRAEALKARKGDFQDRDPKKDLAEAKAELARANVRGRQSYFNLRNVWSAFIILWITGLILFNCGITVAVGLGILDYVKYEWFITTVLIQTFLQIVGLGAVAVAYLFKDN